MMEYINFITNDNILQDLKGSSEEEISRAEKELGFRMPNALKEYLLLTGESADLYSIWDYHGTKDLKYLYDWIYDWINRYRSEGVDLNEIKTILPFFKWQDTFFYIPIEEGNENPPVYAFDINDTPTIRRLNDFFTDFISDRYNQLLARKSPS